MFKLYNLRKIYQILTLEGWTEMMIDGQMTVNTHTWVFNVFLAAVGNFILINLLLAIVSIEFLTS